PARACRWLPPRTPVRSTPLPPSGVFVTGTDTGVGKTVVAASIATTLRSRGEPVRAFKPVVTGLDEPDPEWPADHELLARAAGLRPDPGPAHTLGAGAVAHLSA